ncbi:MAG TPA: homoserine kinase [Candidatus Dormibacteraeota bacterium]|jgi:homoserine kinase|nr:homoserine kinase [Candidatus Dormibacteraeota bacterium]
MQVRISVPATVANLGPGFDVLALALELQNEVTAAQTGEPGISIDPGPGAPAELRDPAHNLVARAYTATCAELGVLPQGVHFSCVNRIPFRRGLGSSAAAALAGALCATALHAASWDEQRILDWVAGLEGHPDNAAAALFGGLVIVTPGAPTVTMEIPDDLRAVVFVPDIELSTALARQVVPQAFTRADAVFNASRCALWVRAVALRDWTTLGAAMQDRWHQPPRTALFPALPSIIDAAVGAGARGAALSGAGPSVVALVDGDTAPIAAAMSAAAASCGVGGDALVSRVRNWGARVEVSA